MGCERTERKKISSGNGWENWRWDGRLSTIFTVQRHLLGGWILALHWGCLCLGFALGRHLIWIGFSYSYEINDCPALRSTLNLACTKMKALLRKVLEAKKKLNAQGPWKRKVGTGVFSLWRKEEKRGRSSKPTQEAKRVFIFEGICFFSSASPRSLLCSSLVTCQLFTKLFKTYRRLQAHLGDPARLQDRQPSAHLRPAKLTLGTPKHRHSGQGLALEYRSGSQAVAPLASCSNPQFLVYQETGR